MYMYISRQIVLNHQFIFTQKLIIITNTMQQCTNCLFKDKLYTFPLSGLLVAI